ncbi:MAG TPA: phospholipid carrier-dependent glycosyltransferase, partial [Thermoleophilaceae bacterium]
AYVQVLAETGHLPQEQTPSRYVYSQEEEVALAQERFFAQAQTRHIGVWTGLEQGRLQRSLAARLSRSGDGAGTASVQPPLFYALETLPYRLGSAGSLLQRLALMRLLVALLAACTVLFVFLFAREVLPSTPWAWTTAALAVALQPVFGYESSGVNPDALLAASSAALFYCIARAFRRGLDSRLAVAAGIAICIGLSTKITFAGLVPGALVGLTAIALRQRTLRSLRFPAIAAGIGLVPVALITMLQGDAAASDSTAGVDLVGQTASSTGSLVDRLAYMWQFYLPRLPGMPDSFGMSALFQGWLPGFTGLFGYAFAVAGHPTWVKAAVFAATAIGAILATWWLIRARRQVRGRAAELVVYGLMAAGLLGGIASTAYLSRSSGIPGYLIQVRYLFPLAALGGLGVAAAARFGGRRWGPAIATAIVILILGQNVASQLLAISSWYA